MSIIPLSAAVLFINLPFGYWRANVKKLSLQWILAIHIPVPLVIALRIFAGVGFEFITYPIFVAAFFAGQVTGTWVYNLRKLKKISPVSSCLVMDILRTRKGDRET